MAHSSIALKSHSGVLEPSSMDVESERCRRTDGKKWRCRWPVLPHQKYCERHVHRGRLRSRKLVEVPKTVPTSNSTVPSLKPPASNLPSAPINNARSHSQIHVKNQSFKTVKHCRENALELGFSTKGVLQNGNAQGCGPSHIDHNLTLAVPGTKRCRRTDGKKWRCRKDALPKQSYCIQHMHRGVKKVENRQNLKAFVVGSSYQQMENVGNRSNDDSSGKFSGGDATAIST